MPRVRILLRRDTAAAWTAANPVLAEGEVGVETDTAKIKIGNGFTAWVALPYYDSVQRSDAAPEAIGTAAAGISALVSRADHVHALPSAISCDTINTSGNALVGGALTVTGALVGGAHTHTASDVSDFAEAVDDRVAALLVAGAGVVLTYNDAANSLTVAVSGALDGGSFTGALA